MALLAGCFLAGMALAGFAFWRWPPDLASGRFLPDPARFDLGLAVLDYAASSILFALVPVLWCRGRLRDEQLRALTQNITPGCLLALVSTLASGLMGLYFIGAVLSWLT